MENQQLSKIYSKNQIDIAAFIGGPLIASYLISQNFKIFGDKEASKKTILIGLISTVIFFGVLVLLPESITSKIPNISTAIIPIIIADLIVRQYQSKKIEDYHTKGYPKASSLGVLGKSVISLIITLISVFLLYQVVTFINVKYNYAGYLKNYCNSSYNEKSISKDKVYVPEDASCFVLQRLKEKGFTLQQVDQVLTLEFDYQKEIGIVGNSEKDSKGNDYNPLPYIKKHQTLGLSDEQINLILNEELEYMKFIGIEVTETKPK
ncbi:hypothetical protein A3I48_04160 [Candidatus Daviesbacteria bacterium RIFCSPLOWO2_02_FULL_36_7]|uniref:Uncharacterized protein n=1 Tax=Candidatus Daviesbacteria bacterium RIFCSPLOWO2_02_FULL_36_7 TaxID=1797792 RepID=A0A1F5MHU9_9BACT|nr:MAG: hypothetical protein A3I48_04160 [Candidatus Daviesbacteria bacterium RIFCSPLOWO2_02_FULL_36_7]